MPKNTINQLRQIVAFKNLILLVFVFSINFCFAQDKIINNIKTYNEEGNYRKAVALIEKYQEKKYDKLNYNYLISLADYYCIPGNNEYNPFKAISLVKDINCEKISNEILGIYFKEIQDCNLVLKNKNDRYVSLYFEIIYNSNDIDSLKSFYTDFKSYNEYSDQVFQKIALISFNKAKQSNSKSELLKFQEEFENTPFASEAKSLIEVIDYESAISTNTIESYTGFLKNYPQTNKRDKILPLLEALKWQECVSLNTKTSYQTFINEFPNSTKLQEANMMLSKFVDVHNLKAINSFTTVSNEKQRLRLFKISHGKLEYPSLRLLKISHDGKTALAIDANSKYDGSKNTARLIDLTDGAIIFDFTYVDFSNYFFNSDDSKLFYYDNKFIKQIDLNSFEITNLFEIERNKYTTNFQYMCIEKNTIHFCQEQKESPRNKYLHHTYDLSTTKKDLEVFYDLDWSVRSDIQKAFSAFTGTTEEKLLKLKIIYRTEDVYRDDLIIKPLTENSTNEFLLLHFPLIMVIKNGEFIYKENITVYKTDIVTNEIKPDYDYRDNNSCPKPVITENNEIVYISEDALYILPLGTNEGTFLNNEIIKTKHIDPFKIEMPTRLGAPDFLFAELDCKAGKLYYQVDKKGSTPSLDNTVFVHNYNSLHELNNAQMKLKIDYELKEIDKELYAYYSSYINPETIKNQPLESDREKYLRLRNVYLKKNPTFNAIQDSLFYSINEIVKDSIKIVNHDPVKVFIASNYNLDNEFWRLPIKNPFNGKNFSIIYNQPIADAKLNLSQNFSEILVEVKYYFNLISLSYEPILVSITNKQSNKCDKFFIPYKDGSLLKNLYYTDAMASNSIFTDQVLIGNLSYDENIFRYFVSNGRPKIYINYEYVKYQEKLRMRNLDDFNLNFEFEGWGELECRDCRYDLFSLDDVPYFVNRRISSDKSRIYVYEINEAAPICTMDSIQYYVRDAGWIAGTYSFTNAFYNHLANGWVIKETKVTSAGNFMHAATIEIIDSRSSNVIKTFNMFELGNISDDIYEYELNYEASISPNGKYFAVRCKTKTYLYETSNWTNVMNFDNTSGTLYWDCNSYYLGVGTDLIPLLLLDLLETK